jgi:hypothetical protein
MEDLVFCESLDFLVKERVNFLWVMSFVRFFKGEVDWVCIGV